ncbi:hypothetical protein BGW36DRAFT_345295 [Talaromyces proteolyticus]|uniref:Fe2OG dioxygenase domain-containing protein n=1 Tax=Talaromyces proteolyticus TaxID=1131652 RepID=A0AAD4KQ21_9EURO|nr:uncharacterized protein BGW36DRAFT_345295 [Talaromyces proteolyticus]KAH8693614.1 hypothetical protein BGW36DRAFT_345295 [Talaromyces proteolyticus]
MEDISYEIPPSTSHETCQIIQETPQETIAEEVQEQEISSIGSQNVSKSTPSNSGRYVVPIHETLSSLERIPFDPSKHIEFSPPSKTWTMQELDYTEGQGISVVGVSEPFPLFSKEAVMQMRAEILSEEVWDKYQFSSNLSHCQLRGYVPECAPFTYDVWKSPEILDIVSKIAGIDLVPVMDWEIAHINISIQSEGEQAKALEVAQRDADEGVAACPLEDDHPILDWHTDSYPFVCVTMLSDCTNMIGGETALRKGNGGIVKVRGPQMGSAVILQGRYIEHQAMRAFGTSERITSVTSFRPRAPNIKDDTVLTTVRPISDLKELYHQYTEYRFEVLQDRLQDMSRKLRDRKRAHRSYDTEATKAFIREQIEFLEAMDREIIIDKNVQRGYIDDGHLVSDEIKQSSKRKGTYDIV